MEGVEDVDCKSISLGAAHLYFPKNFPRTLESWKGFAGAGLDMFKSEAQLAGPRKDFINESGIYLSSGTIEKAVLSWPHMYIPSFRKI